MAAVCHLGFSYFGNICQNLKLALISTSKFGEDRTSCCIFSIFKTATVRHLGFGMTT